MLLLELLEVLLREGAGEELSWRVPGSINVSEALRDEIAEADELLGLLSHIRAG